MKLNIYISYTFSVSVKYYINNKYLYFRIVYGKLLGGGGPKSGSKCSGQNRRTAIMRFLVGCEEPELIVFMQMVFRVLNCQVQCKTLNSFKFKLHN